ncbi:MAG: ribonuclease Z [Treponematales bacterium]
MNLEAFVLGCGGMAPLPHRHLTSILLRREGKRKNEFFLFDCGEGTQVPLRRLNMGWKQITAVLISHTHADHVTGLPGLLMLSSQVDREEPLYIIGPPRIAEYIDTSRRVLDMFINYEIIVREIEQPGVVYEDEEYLIRAFPLRHTKPCCGYTLEERARPGVFHPELAEALNIPVGPLYGALQAGQTIVTPDGREVRPEEVVGPARKGRKFTFVTDTLAFPEIAAEAAGSGLFVCEGMFEEALAEAAHEKKHMTAAEAAALARDAGGVKQLALIHYSPRYTDSELTQLLTEAQSVFPASALTKDRMSFPLEYEE